jgi:hypothetical protein
MVHFSRLLQSFGCLSALIMLLVVFGCNRDKGGETEINILEGATEFTGTLPGLVPMTYSFEEKTFKVKTYNSQFIIHFDTRLDETAAKKIIDAQGATIIEKVPLAGYYLVELPPSQIWTFLVKMDYSDSVLMITPNIPGYFKSYTNIIDNCGLDHGQMVEQALKDCGGTFDVCRDVTYVDPAQPDKVFAPMNKVIRKFYDYINAAGSGPAFLNISINGGLDGTDYSKLPADSQQMARDSWFIFMQGILMSIASLPESRRANLVVTIAAGNENMPIDGILSALRDRDRIAGVLEKNVVIVTTARQLDPPANYGLNDPDVVVMNNQASDRGSSLAAPCVLGMIQQVMEERGISVAEAVALVKQAAFNNPEHELLWSDVLPMVTYTTNPSTVTFGPYTQKVGPFMCESMFYFNIAPVMQWRNGYGTLVMPVHFYRTATGGEGCIMSGITQDDKTYQILLQGTDSDIRGTGIENILSGSYNENLGMTGFYNVVEFKGSSSMGGAITGQLTMMIELPVQGTMQVMDTRTTTITFTKQ